MKLKIKEQEQVIVPFYTTTGEFNIPRMGFTIKNKFKYVNLPTVVPQPIEIYFSKTFINSLPLSFYTNMKKYADMNISDLYVLVGPKAPVVWASPGYYLDYTYYGVYRPKSTGRLLPWSNPLNYPASTIFSLINGLTAIAGVCSLTTYDQFGIFSALNAEYGVLTGGSGVETRLNNFKDGITGGKNLIKRPYSFNDVAAFGYYNVNSHPLWTYSGKPNVLRDTSAWGLPINKLLAVLEDIDQRQALNIPQYLGNVAAAWRYQREIYNNNNGITPNLKTQAELDALNTDILNNLKIFLDEYKTHYPLARPQNAVTGNKSSTVPWTGYDNPSYPAGLCGPNGGVRLTPYPLGATYDYMFAEGVTYNTWSPKGWTRDQGHYLFDGWGVQHLLNIAYHLTDAPGNIDPVTNQKQLINDDDWGNILNDVRILLLKEVFDAVKHLEEGRPWYSKRKYWDDGTVKDGYVWPSGKYPDGNNWAQTKPAYSQYKTGGGYFYPDPDNRGYITSNQNITPLAYRLMAAMYLYPYARTKEEKQALLAAYNMFMEYFAGMMERYMYGVTDPDKCGNWSEGWAYASQSMPDFLKVLDITRKMGDRRLWDNKNTPDYFNPSIPGVQYKNWCNNNWKWIVSRIMPNNLIINYGSCNTAGWEVAGNNYQFSAYDLLYQTALLSETPIPGATGSAIAELHDWFDVVNSSSSYSLDFFNAIKQYKKGPIKDKALSKGFFTETEQVFVWKSDAVIPKYHSDWLYGTNSSLKNNFSKPLIFGIWGKGVGIMEEKTNQDGGHLSAYLGDAIILMETGELRALNESPNNDIKQYFWLNTYRAKGHNKMQLGERLDAQAPKNIRWTGVTFGQTGGYAFIDATDVYNRVGLTGPNYGWAPTDGYLWQSTGYPYDTYRNKDPYHYLAHPTYGVPNYTPYTFVDPTTKITYYGFEPYQYQIRTCTRGITWNYFNNVAKIQIEDIVGISAMNQLYPGASWYATGPYATGPDTRVYYRFHVGYTGAVAPNTFPIPKEGSDTGLTYYAIQGTNNTTWNACWKQPIPFNSNTAGSQYDYVGITMTFIGSQPIRLEKELTTNNTFKYSPQATPGGPTTPSRHYAINVLLGTSGGEYYDEKNLKLNTTIDAVAFLK